MSKNIIFKITEMDVKTMNFWYLVFAVTPKQDFDVLMCSNLLREGG